MDVILILFIRHSWLRAQLSHKHGQQRHGGKSFPDHYSRSIHPVLDHFPVHYCEFARSYLAGEALSGIGLVPESFRTGCEHPTTLDIIFKSAFHPRHPNSVHCPFGCANFPAVYSNSYSKLWTPHAFTAIGLSSPCQYIARGSERKER